MVNSAFFGLQNYIESPAHAVNLLGLDAVQNIVLAAGVFDQFEDPKLPGFSLENIYKRSMAVGAGAKFLATTFGLMRRLTDEALMAGMLHDVGKLVMLSHFQGELQESVRLSESESMSLHQAQKEILGCNDAEIGAHLLSLWGLPDSILEAVALHYSPSISPSPIMNVLTSVHLAFALDYDLINKIRDPELSVVDMDYLDKLNMSNQLDSLRNISQGAMAPTT